MDELQAIVDERAYECAAKYREKLRRLHLSHLDYNLDTVKRVSHVSTTDDSEQGLKSMALTHTTTTKTSIDSSKHDDYDDFLPISVV